MLRILLSFNAENETDNNILKCKKIVNYCMLMVVKLKKDTQIAAYRNCLSIGKQKKTT